jgi:hypothetical protein
VNPAGVIVTCAYPCNEHGRSVNSRIIIFIENKL